MPRGVLVKWLPVNPDDVLAEAAGPPGAMDVDAKWREGDGRSMRRSEFRKREGFLDFGALAVAYEGGQRLIASDGFIDRGPSPSVRPRGPKDDGHQRDEGCKEDFQKHDARHCA